MKNYCNVNNWTIYSFGELIKSIQNGFASGERDKNGIIQFRMNNVNCNAQMILDDYIRVPMELFKEKYNVQRGDILFNHTNSAEMVGKSFVFNGYKEPVTFSNHFSRIRLFREIADPQFIVYYFVQLFHQRFFENLCDRWIHQAAFQNEKIMKIPIALPPLFEQKRIVKIIESKLKIIENIKNAINDQLYLTELFFDSYLQKIICNYEGKKCKLGDIGNCFIGLTYSPDNISTNGIPVLRSGNIQNAKLDFSDIVRVKQKIKDTLFLCNKDILICARNGSKKLIGKAALVQDLPEKMSFGAFMSVFRSQYNNYVYYFLQTKYFRQQLTKSGTNTVNQLTQEVLKNIYIYLPSINEQKIIVKMIDQKFKHIEILRTKLNNQLSYINALTSSILHKAFQGEL